MRNLIVGAICFVASSALAGVDVPEWIQLNKIVFEDGVYRSVGGDPWLVAEEFDPILDAEKCVLVLEVQTSRPEKMQVFWKTGDGDMSQETSAFFRVEPSDAPVTVAVDLGQYKTFGPIKQLRFDPSEGAGLKMKLNKFELVGRDELGDSPPPYLFGFMCRPSKLHYRPGERIDYHTWMNVRNYPDRESSKILGVKILDKAGQEVGSAVQHYGLHPMAELKELRGTVKVPRALTPGAYTIEGTSTDQRSGFQLNASFDFGVQAPDDPLIYETPFKYQNDFTTIRDEDGRWHVIAITGDRPEGEHWRQDGQGRTFSHASSPDLRNWDYHKPVITIHNRKYSDGDGFYQNRNVWARM